MPSWLFARSSRSPPHRPALRLRPRRRCSTEHRPLCSCIGRCSQKLPKNAVRRRRFPAKLWIIDILQDVSGGRTRARTWDPLIKSQLLYQLSYAPGLPSAGSPAGRGSLSKGETGCPAALPLSHQTQKAAERARRPLEAMASCVREIASSVASTSRCGPHCGRGPPSGPIGPRSKPPGPRCFQPCCPCMRRSPPNRASMTKRCFWASSRLL